MGGDMHGSVMSWLGETVAVHNLAGRSVLEVGSYDVNGSPRRFFTGSYLGVDLAPGPGVDRVAVASALPFGDGEFPVVVSTEMLEHTSRPWADVAEMARVLAPGGFLLLTARGYDERGCWEVHGYPQDHWRFGEGTLALLASDAGLTVLSEEKDPEGPGWMLVATKPVL